MQVLAFLAVLLPVKGIADCSNALTYPAPIALLEPLCMVKLGTTIVSAREEILISPTADSGNAATALKGNGPHGRLALLKVECPFV